jgi:hypothetical protein
MIFHNFYTLYFYGVWEFVSIRRSFFVGIENDIIQNTCKFPHRIKIEDILSFDDDIFRKTRNTCPYENRRYIGYTSVYISQQRHIFRISGMLEKRRETRYLSIESYAKD